MGETKVNKLSMNIRKNSKEIYSRVIDPAFQRIFTQLPQQLHNSIQTHIRKSAKDDVKTNSETSTFEKDKGLSRSFEVDLEKQLQAWKDNPVWVDQPPEIRVNVPKGSLCNLIVKVNIGLPPDAVYNIVTDPDNKRVFKNIKEVVSRKVLVDEGSRQVVEVEQAALWRFLWWSGTIPVHVLVDQNREDRSMRFKQVKPGFMKKFEGLWRVEPLFVDEESCFPSKPVTPTDYRTCAGGKGRVGSQVRLDQLIQPAIVPPPPISWYLRGITAKTTEMLINDLIAEAANIRGFGSTKYSGAALGQSQSQSEGISDERRSNENRDIRERWAAHRREARKCRRRSRWVSKTL